PEQRAVLSNPPILVLEPPIARGDLELPWRLSGVDVFLRIEQREVSSDDFARLVSVDALRAVVPADDVAARVEHEDAVIPHALNNETKALLVQPELLGRGAALREVAGDLGEADERAVVVPQRRDRDVRPEPRAVLADAPAFVLDVSLGLRDVEQLLRLAAGDVLGWVEDREV